MRYTVVWIHSADMALANLWLHASDRQAITDTARYMDITLANDPETKGKPQGKFFVLEKAPLAVLYQVDPGDCMVRVLTVKRI